MLALGRRQRGARPVPKGPRTRPSSLAPALATPFPDLLWSLIPKSGCEPPGVKCEELEIIIKSIGLFPP